MNALIQIILSVVVAIVFDLVYKYQIQITYAVGLRQRLPIGYKIGPWTKIVAMVSYMVPANIAIYYHIPLLNFVWAWFFVAFVVYLLHVTFLYIREMPKS